jgi:hypothetical protein
MRRSALSGQSRRRDSGTPRPGLAALAERGFSCVKRRPSKTSRIHASRAVLARDGRVGEGRHHGFVAAMPQLESPGPEGVPGRALIHPQQQPVLQ